MASHLLKDGQRSLQKVQLLLLPLHGSKAVPGSAAVALVLFLDDCLGLIEDMVGRVDQVLARVQAIMINQLTEKALQMFLFFAFNGDVTVVAFNERWKKSKLCDEVGNLKYSCYGKLKPYVGSYLSHHLPGDIDGGNAAEEIDGEGADDRNDAADVFNADVITTTVAFTKDDKFVLSLKNFVAAHDCQLKVNPLVMKAQHPTLMKMVSSLILT